MSKVCLIDQDPSVRLIAGDTFGRLCSSFQEVDVARQIKSLTDSVISNREPNARAGFAFALGSILYYMGGMAAGLHLRTVLGLLLSLANDPHPTVHFWALEGLERTINSSGLSFSSHVPSCLGAVSSLILSDLFDPEDVISFLSTTAMENPTLASLIRCLDAIINVMGPDLASSKKSRSLICMLVSELDHDTETLVSNEAIRCMQHLNLFAPDAIDVRHFIQRAETNLTSSIPQIRQLSCEIIYGLIRKDIALVFRTARPSLPDELWALLNLHEQAHADVREIISCWVDQTALSDGKRWIEMCLKFLTGSGQRDTVLKGDSKSDAIGGEPSEFIDEAAAFSSQPGNKPTAGEMGGTYLRWEAVSFALVCLRQVVELNLRDSPTKVEDPTNLLVVSVGDLIRAAFTACTSTVVDVRLGGLKLLHDLIKVIVHRAPF
jgi:HEAT repeat-containing protein 5